MVKRRRNRIAAAKSNNSDASSSDELNDARVNFEGALQCLSKPPKEESGSSDEERQKKDSSKDLAKDKPVRKHHPFVMKLFDRSVDLAQFSEDTPLYPMCRAWMLNQPQLVYNLRQQPEESDKGDSQTNEGESQEEATNDSEPQGERTQDIHCLPPPEPHTDDTRKAKIPNPVVHDSKFNVIQNGAEPPSKDELLKDNLIRWNKVRKSWLNAAAENEKRYEKSFKILTSVYDKSEQ